MFILPESIKKIGMKTTKKSWKHHFPHYKSMGGIFRHSSANYSILCGTFWSKFELLLDIMHVLDTYKFIINWINTKREKLETSIFRRLRVANLWSVVGSGRISNSSKLLCMSKIACKYEKDPIKNNQEKVAAPFFKLCHYLLPWKPVVRSCRISNSSKL